MAKHSPEDFLNKLESFPEPNQFTGDKEDVLVTDSADSPEDWVFKELSDTEELTKQLDVYISVVNDRESSPFMLEGSGFVTAYEAQDLLKSLLHNKGFAPQTIFGVMRSHTTPVVENINNIYRSIKNIEDKLKSIDNSNPFVVLLSDKNTENEKTSQEEHLRELKINLKRQSGVYAALIKSIIETPQEFGLISVEDFKTSNETLSAADLKERMFGDTSETPAKMFTVDGKRMQLPAVIKLCKDAIRSHPDIIASDKMAPQATELLYINYIRPIIDSMFDIVRDDDLKNEEREERLDQLSAELAEILSFILTEKNDENDISGVAIAGSFVWNRKFPKGYKIEDLPLQGKYLDRLLDREPEMLKKELKDSKGEEKFFLRLRFHVDRVMEMPDDVLDDTISRIKLGDRDIANEIFSTSYGHMSMYRRLALCKVLIERELGDNFDEGAFRDFYAIEVKDLFTEEFSQLQEKRNLNKKKEGYGLQVRGIEKRIRKIQDKLVKSLTEYLSDDSRYTKLMENMGGSEGLLLIGFSEDPSDDEDVTDEISIK